MADAREFLNSYNARERAIEASRPNAIDDARHRIVEEGWFGKQTTGNTQWSPSPEEPSQQAVADSGSNPYTLDGIGQAGDADANPQGVKEAAHDFYGNPNPEYEGTVWQNEGESEVKTPEIAPATSEFDHGLDTHSVWQAADTKEPEIAPPEIEQEL